MTRTRTVRHALFAGLATLSLGLAACGDDDSEGGDDTTATDDTTTEDTATDITTDDTATEDTATEDTATEDTGTDDTAGSDAEAYATAAGGQLGMVDPERAQCVGEALVDAIGLEQIQATGLSPEEFASSSDLGEAGIEVTDGLVDDMAAGFTECGGLEEELIQSEFSDDPEVAACVADILDDAIIAEVLATTVVGAEPSEEALAAQAQTQECTAGTTPTT